MTWQEDALIHAKQEAPRESCGLLVNYLNKEKYIPCKNLALHNDLQFMLDPLDWADTEDRYGRIHAVIHSHPIGTEHPSEADVISCKRSNVTWYIIGLKTKRWFKFKPTDKIETLQRDPCLRQ